MAKRLIIILLVVLFTGNFSINSMPAYPKRIPIVVDDGIVYIQLFGDEHRKRAENLDGYTVIQKEGKWYYAEKDTEGWLKPSIYKLSAYVTNDTKQFLKDIPKHIKNGKDLVKMTHNKSTHQILHSQNAVGARKVLVILMQYKDLSMVKSPDDFNGLFNSTGYSYDGAKGSVCDFYTDVSYGQMQLTCDIIGPFTSKYGRAHYGGNNRSGEDNHPEALFEEAITQAAEQVSLKDYDADDDGFVDNVHIIFAGHGEEAGASDEAIWSHEATFFQPFVIQRMKIDRYSCAPELRGNTGRGISRIGPHCHEIGHALGAMDYYDTDYDADGNYMGTGDWDVMASGSWNNDGITPADFNPYVKAFDFGWVALEDLPSGNVTISPSCEGSENYYILKSPLSSDLYLLENRSKRKWGQGVPGEGMLVFHIHPDISSSNNSINSKAPQKCYIVCASSRTRRPGSNPSSYGDINSDGCPYPGRSNNTDFGQSSFPTAFFWNDEECGIELNNISFDSEGSIHLENNSTCNEDTERKRIFFEGFEENPVSVVIDTDEENPLASSWTVESNSLVPSKIITRPSAYKGSKSLQLSAKRAAEKATSQFSFNIPFVAEAGEGVLILKLYVNTLNPQTDNPNTIRVSYRTKDNDEWQHSDILSSENNLWRQSIVELPNNLLPEIIIEGIAYSGSVLAIDNLEVEQIVGNGETAIPIVQRNSLSDKSAFYSISGIKVTKNQKGINIVRMHDGSTYKILK